MNEYIGGKYKHFKGSLYDVYCVAIDKNQKKYVLYQQCYGDLSFWIRPYELFFDTVIDEKQEHIQRFSPTSAKRQDLKKGISRLITRIERDDIIIRHSETEQEYCITSLNESEGIVCVHTISACSSGYLTEYELARRMGYYSCIINDHIRVYKKKYFDEKFKLKIGNNEQSILTDQMNPCSIDLQIADVGFLNTKRQLIDPQSVEHISSATNLWKGAKVYHSKHGALAYFKLRPGETVLTHTKDRIRIPNDCAGKIEIKSTYARFSLSITFGDFCNPGYDGHFPLEITNHGKHTIIIHANETMAQLMLIPLQGPVLIDYSKKATYRNNRGYDDGTPYSFWRERSIKHLRKKMEHSS